MFWICVVGERAILSKKIGQTQQHPLAGGCFAKPSRSTIPMVRREGVPCKPVYVSVAFLAIIGAQSQ